MSAIVAMLLTASTLQAAPVVPLWPAGAPGSESRRNEPETKPNPWSIGHIYNPSVTVYLPPAGTGNGTAVVVAPGGGHRELVVGEEGTKAAAMLNKLGVAAFVLKYRLAREEGSGLTIEKDTFADGVRAMRLVRSRAAEWKIDPKRIGIMGFSAGGEVASMVAFLPPPVIAKPDEVDLADATANFGIWIYPGPLGVPEALPATAPPAFMLVASDDGLAPVTLGLATKYRTAKRPFEVHVLNGGGHGFNMGDRSSLAAVKNWSQRLADWMGDMGYLKPASTD